MTVSSTAVQTAGSLGNGATTNFTFSFRIFANGDTAAEDQIQVVLVTVATGAETVLTKTTHYSVAVNADQDSSPGGSITTVATYSSAYKIFIRRAPDYKQSTDLGNQAPFNAQTIEDTFDQIKIELQDLRQKQLRSPHAGIQSSQNWTGEMTGVPTAGQVPLVNADADGFILGTPIGVATEAMADLNLADTLGEAQALLDQGNDWVSVAAAATVDLGAVDSKKVLVTGSYYATGNITSLGSATNGTEKIVRFDNKNRLTSSSSLDLGNNGVNMPVYAGDVLTFVRESTKWRLIDYKSAWLYTVRDRTSSGGAFEWMWAVGPDANTSWPVLAYDGAYSQGRFVVRGGQHLIGFGDGIDLCYISADGNASAPTERAAPHRIGHWYGWAWDETSLAPPKPGGIGGGAPYTGRAGNISVAAIDTPEQYARGGAILVGTCQTGGDASDPQIVPYENFWVRDGGVVFAGFSTIVGPTGRGVDGDARVSAGGARISYPFEYGGAAKNINSPGYINWIDTKPDGNVHIIASDITKGFYALCIRMEDGDTNGWDWGVDQTNDHLVLASVSADTRTSRVAYDSSGNHFPTTTGGVSSGKGSNRWSGVYGNVLSLNGSTSTSTATAFIKNASESFAGNVLDVRADRSAGTAFNLISATVDDNGTPNNVYVVDGAGASYQRQTTTQTSTGGAVNIRSNTTLLSNVSGASVTATNLRPANGRVIGVVTRITTQLGAGMGTTGYQVGDGSDADRYGVASAVTAGTTTGDASTPPTADPMSWSSTAQNVVITAVGGNFNGVGAIRVTCFYLDMTAPTS